MSQTSGDSKSYDVVCMSFGKENERGIEVVEANKKDSFLEQTMEIQAIACSMDEMNLSKEQKQKVLENRKARKTKSTLLKEEAR